MSIIRHATQCHRGLGSEIAQQLWLMIFTVPSVVLREEYPPFPNGSQKHASFEVERGGLCHDFNRSGICKRNKTRVDSAIFVSGGAHAGHQCPIAQTPRTDEVHSSNSQRNFERAKRWCTYIFNTNTYCSHLTRRHTSWAQRHAVCVTIRRQFKIWGSNWIWGRSNP